MVSRRPWGLIVACVPALILTGCSGSGNDKWVQARPATYGVRGRVQSEGEPVAGAKVVFHTTEGGSGRLYTAFGYTDSRGNFRLQTFEDGDGAIAGEHRVTIEKILTEQPPAASEADVAPAAVEKSLLPDRYRSPETSGLTASITADGANSFEFTLEGQ